MNIYNVVNHKLDGEKLRKLNEFTTDLYGGVLGSSSVSNVFTYSGGTVSINTNALINGELYVLCGGCLVTLTGVDLPTSIENKIYYLQVLTDFSDDSIVSDSSADVSIVSDTNSSNVTTYASTGQSIVIEGGFKVPLFMLNGSVFTSIVKIKDKSSTQDWLSQTAIADLWDSLYNVFVCQAGSTTEHPSGGNIGNFNITGGNVLLDNRDFIFGGPHNEIGVNPVYAQGPVFVQDVSGYNILTSEPTLSVIRGGTNASNRQQAKLNLGIYYGTADPGTDYPVSNPMVGDLYFKILEN